MKIVKFIFAFLFVFAVVFAPLYKLEVYTPEAFAALGALALSLVFEYFPAIKDDYDKLPPDQKRFVMVGLVFLAVAGAFGLSCLSEIVAFACTAFGALDAVIVFFFAIGVNQIVHFADRFAQRLLFR